jgi:dTDP-4-dehydrorhamnose reductase
LNPFSKTKILLTGANGQVGRELARKGPREGFHVLSYDRKALDITDPRAVESAIQREACSLVINAAAYTAVDMAESEPAAAFAVNRDGPDHLASACAREGIPLIHISTDYVFDGQKGRPYLETDAVSPLSVYGRSKEEGERRIRAKLKAHVIIRTAWLYGIHGHNFVRTMLRLGRERPSLKVVDDQFGSPTYAADLAEAIIRIAGRCLERKSVVWGTYHYCGAGVTTWFGFAEAVFRLAGGYEDLRVRDIVPIPTSGYPTPARRPSWSVLDCSLIKRTFGITPLPWQESLARMMQDLFLEDTPSAAMRKTALTENEMES